MLKMRFYRRWYEVLANGNDGRVPEGFLRAYALVTFLILTTCGLMLAVVGLAVAIWKSAGIGLVLVILGGSLVIAVAGGLLPKTGTIRRRRRQGQIAWTAACIGLIGIGYAAGLWELVAAGGVANLFGLMYSAIKDRRIARRGGRPG